MEQKPAQHEMRLTRENIEDIARGTKTLELRLLDEKRRAVKLGDTIIFENREDAQGKVSVRVVDLIMAPTFGELFQKIDLQKAGWSADASTEKAVADMRRYYPEEEERRYGIVAIQVELLK